MPKVRFLPIDQVCEATEDESILDVAINNDIPLMHACVVVFVHVRLVMFTSKKA